ncbi:DMT family transporter [Desulfogranum mediterraneum]|uniref:DMT family transporter n=1 Tax=Desulfogranum mediterraneum TaxID=160661 RepID=UPI0004224466|nr:DMT family transporter [Desulfogranum mediterraneum]
MKAQPAQPPGLAGYLCAIGATAIWSGNFIVARDLSSTIPPVSLAFWRWTVAVLVFLPFALRPLLNERLLLREHLGYLSITALLGITIFNTLIYLAGHTTTALNLSLIAITFPVFIVILLRILFRDPITLNKSLGILLVAGGVILLITNGDLAALLEISFTLGDLWMVTASLIFALYSILIRYKPQGLSIWAFQLGTFLLGLLFLFPLFIWESMQVPTIHFDTKALLSIAYVGVFASLTAFILWNKAIVSIGPTKSGMIYYTLPLFSGLLAFIFLDEQVGILHLGSALLIISGILIANQNRRGS